MPLSQLSTLAAWISLPFLGICLWTSASAIAFDLPNTEANQSRGVGAGCYQTSSGTYCPNGSGSSRDSDDRDRGVRAADDTSFWDSLLLWPLHVVACAVACPFNVLTGNFKGAARAAKDIIDYSPPARLAADLSKMTAHLDRGQAEPEPQGTAFFGTGGTPATPYPDMRPTTSAQTNYASIGAQADAAQDPTGCVFDGRGGCPRGAQIDYKIGKIGSVTFQYPDPSKVRKAYAHMDAEDKRKLGKLIRQRREAEIDLPNAERAYGEAKAKGMDQSVVSELEQKVRSDKNTINGRNKEIKRIVTRYTFAEDE